VRKAFAKAMGEEWTRSYIDPAGWQDVPERAVVPANRVALREVSGSAFWVLRELGIRAVERVA
jgi:hypothetical protein